MEFKDSMHAMPCVLRFTFHALRSSGYSLLQSLLSLQRFRLKRRVPSMLAHGLWGWAMRSQQSLMTPRQDFGIPLD